MKILGLFFATLLAQAAQAGTSIIPSTYKSPRASHGSPIAVGFSERKSAGVNIDHGSYKTGNFKNEVTDIQPYIYYHLPNGLGFEARDTNTTASESADGNKLALKVAYHLPSQPLVLGLSLVDDDDKFDSGNVSNNSLGLAVGYKLPSDVYFGADVSQKKREFGSSSSDNTYFTLGAGFIDGGLKKPKMAGELSLWVTSGDSDSTTGFTGNCLINIKETEYSSNFSMYTSKGSSFVGFDFAADFAVDKFYLAPQLSLSKTSIDLGSKNSKSSTIILGAEFGLRNAVSESYVALAMGKLDNSSGDDSNAMIISLGYNHQL